MLHKILKKILENQVLLGLGIIALGWLIIEIREILVSLFISYIIMAALNPMVAKLQKNRVPKVVAAIIVYLTSLLAVIVVIVPLFPFFAQQIQSFFRQFPEYLDTATQFLGINIQADGAQELLTQELETIGRNAFGVTQRVFGGLFSFLSVLVISFYLLLDHDRMKQGIIKQFPQEQREKATNTLQAIENKLGSWMRGQLILSFLVGLITWVALSIAGIPFALPLALIAGLLEVIPTIGPIIAAIPAVVVAFSINPTLGLVVIAIYIGIQLLENSILAPKIMQKAVGLNPVIVIIGVIVGGKLLGIPGALLSIPFISLIKVIFTSLEER